MVADKKSWNDVQFWARELHKKYPRTDLITLSDKDLVQMMLSLDAAKGMPELKADDVYCFAVKSQWSLARHGYDDSVAVPDGQI